MMCDGRGCTGPAAVEVYVVGTSYSRFSCGMSICTAQVRDEIRQDFPGGRVATRPASL